MKKSKKFVLAALALLAITGLLALAGCKNDSVPETPAAKLVSISVTPPAQTVYRVGDEVVHKKGDEIGVIATYDDGDERPVTGTITTDTSTLTQSAGVKPVTVRYSEGGIEVSGQFEIRVLPKKLTNYESPNNTDDSWTYVEFGEWPQTIKADNVSVDESKSKEMGMFTYYLGGDDNYYVKHSDKYYKVEPIVWRVLTTSYKAPEDGTVGEILLLAEKILTGGIKWADSINNNIYMESYIRKWLNGNSGTGKTSDYGGAAGFLQTAFTESARKLIADTSVDNSAASTFGTGESTRDNPYVCDKTKDKIFLLSQQEATNSEYGFGAYDDLDIARIRVTTDYAKATGVFLGDPPGDSGWWWLRSPQSSGSSACDIGSDGDAYDIDRRVSDSKGGVVPALSISLQ